MKRNQSKINRNQKKSRGAGRRAEQKKVSEPSTTVHSRCSIISHGNDMSSVPGVALRAFLEHNKQMVEDCGMSFSHWRCAQLPSLGAPEYW